MTLEEGYGFALKALVKTMETTTPSAKKIELVSVNFNMAEEIQGVNISEERIKELLKANGLTVAEEVKDQWCFICSSIVSNSYIFLTIFSDIDRYEIRQNYSFIEKRTN